MRGGDQCPKERRFFYLEKVSMQIIFISILIGEYQKYSCHFVTFEKSKMTCPFNENEASRLSYLTGSLTKLPGEHIPLLLSSCLLSKPVAKAFAIVLA